MTQHIGHDGDDDSEYADDITQMKTNASAHTTIDDTSEIVESSNDAADLIVKLKAENTHFRTQLYSLTALLHKQQTDHLSEADKDKRITYLQRQISTIHSPSRVNTLNNRIVELQRAYDRECKERKTAERECKRLEKACLEVSSRTGSMPLILERMERELHEEKIRSTELRRKAVTFEQSIRRMSIQCVEWSNKYEHEKVARIEAETTLSRIESENPELIAKLEAAAAPPMHDIAEEERLRSLVLKLQRQIDHLNHALKKQIQVNTDLTAGMARLPATTSLDNGLFSGTQPLPQVRVRRPAPTLPTIASKSKTTTLPQRKKEVNDTQLPPLKPSIPVQRRSTKQSIQPSLPPVVPVAPAPAQRKTESKSHRKTESRTVTTKTKAANVPAPVTSKPSRPSRIPRPAADANKLQKALESSEQKDVDPSAQESEDILHLIQSITSSRSTVSSVVVSKPATGRIDTQRLVSPHDTERQNEIDDDYETDYEATDDEHQQHNDDTVDIDESYMETQAEPIEEMPIASQIPSSQPTIADATSSEVDDEYAADTVDDNKLQQVQNDTLVEQPMEAERYDEIPLDSQPGPQALVEAEAVYVPPVPKPSSKRPSPISTPPRQQPKSSSPSRTESRHQTPAQITLSSSRTRTPTSLTQPTLTEPPAQEATGNATEDVSNEIAADNGPGPVEFASPAYADDEFGFDNTDDIAAEQQTQATPLMDNDDAVSTEATIATATEAANATETEVVSAAPDAEQATTLTTDNKLTTDSTAADNASAESSAVVVPSADESAETAEMTDFVDLNALLATERATADAEPEPDTSHYASDSDFES